MTGGKIIDVNGKKLRIGYFVTFDVSYKSAVYEITRVTKKGRLALQRVGRADAEEIYGYPQFMIKVEIEDMI